MLTYGSSDITELQFINIRHEIERRNEQWFDVYVRFDLLEPALVPDNIEELEALLVSTSDGLLVEIAPQDEGRDCEYQFTESEKEQLRRYFQAQVKPELNNG